MDNAIAVVIVGILSLIGTMSGSWAGVRQSNKLVNWRIDQLEAKVMKHNCLVERMSLCERDIRALDGAVNELKTKWWEEE